MHHKTKIDVCECFFFFMIPHMYTSAILPKSTFVSKKRYKNHIWSSDSIDIYLFAISQCTFDSPIFSHKSQKDSQIEDFRSKLNS